MNFRTFLESQGLTEKDIEEALEESRETVEMARKASLMAKAGLEKAMMSVKNERVAKMLLLGYSLANKVNEGCTELLKK